MLRSASFVNDPDWVTTLWVPYEDTLCVANYRQIRVLQKTFPHRRRSVKQLHCHHDHNYEKSVYCFLSLFWKTFISCVFSSWITFCQKSSAFCFRTGLNIHFVKFCFVQFKSFYQAFKKYKTFENCPSQKFYRLRDRCYKPNYVFKKLLWVIMLFVLQMVIKSFSHAQRCLQIQIISNHMVRQQTVVSNFCWTSCVGKTWDV